MLALLLLWGIHFVYRACMKFSNLADITYPPHYQQFLNLFDVFSFGEVDDEAYLDQINCGGKWFFFCRWFTPCVEYEAPRRVTATTKRGV